MAIYNENHVEFTNKVFGWNPVFKNIKAAVVRIDTFFSIVNMRTRLIVACQGLLPGVVQLCVPFPMATSRFSTIDEALFWSCIIQRICCCICVENENLKYLKGLRKISGFELKVVTLVRWDRLRRIGHIARIKRTQIGESLTILPHRRSRIRKKITLEWILERYYVRWVVGETDWVPCSMAALF